MQIRLRLFARLRELAGRSEMTLDVPSGWTARRLWEGLALEYPALADYERVVSCAINEEYAQMSTPLNDGDEVAFLPPVSGG